MKKITLACLFLFTVSTATAEVYRWDNDDLLTTSVAEPSVNPIDSFLLEAQVVGAILNDSNFTGAIFHRRQRT